VLAMSVYLPRNARRYAVGVVVVARRKWTPPLAALRRTRATAWSSAPSARRPHARTRCWCRADMALWIVERERGRQVADAVAREMEHERRARVLQRHG